MTQIKKTAMTALCALLALSAAGVDAHAVPTISFAVSESAGTPISIGSTTTGIGSLIFTTANFTGNVSAVGSPILPQPTLQTTSIDARTTTTADGTLYIWITEQNLTMPTGMVTLLSGFTSNLFTGGAVSVIENTFVSTSNALWAGTALQSKDFVGIGSTSLSALSPSLGGLYSETAEFIVHIRGAGSVNDSINIAAVPEPASLTLLGIGMIATGAMVRRRRSSETPAAG